MRRTMRRVPAGHGSTGFRVLAALVLAIFCNTIRVTALTLIVHYYGVDPLKTTLHEISGLIAFAIVLVALFAIAGRTALMTGQQQ